jgi:hypothetical protein
MHGDPADHKGRRRSSRPTPLTSCWPHFLRPRFCIFAMGEAQFPTSDSTSHS